MKIPYISPGELVSRYGFMCRSTAHQPFNNVQIIEDDLAKLEHLIKVDLVNLARKESPNDFIEVYTAMLHELDRFKVFCIYPATATKFVVAIGGAFSAGKSSLINKLIGNKLLPSDIAKVTSQPTFVLHGSKNEIHALNLHGHPILLSDSEFASLKHGKGGELEKYGSQIAGILQNVFITRADFKWENIAISDTPGYNPDDSHSHGRSDAQLAQSQLNAANAIIWTVDINKGTMTTSDMQFLGALSPQIPLLIVLTKADSKPNSDIERILLEVRNKLSQHGIPVVDVIAVSTRTSLVHSINSITKYFNKWNTSKTVPTFARNFSILFSRYSSYLEAEKTRALAQLGYVNKMLAQQNIGGLEPIHDTAKDRLAALENEVFPLLRKIEFDFFATLKNAYSKIGKLPIYPILQPAPKSTFLQASKIWLHGAANKQGSSDQDIEIYSTTEQFNRFVPEEFWKQWSGADAEIAEKALVANSIVEKKYRTNNDGTITDEKTKHVWERTDAAKAKSRHGIVTYLAVFILGGSVVFGYFSLIDKNRQIATLTPAPAPIPAPVSVQATVIKTEGCSYCPEMVSVPSGTFVMGNSATEQSELIAEGLEKEMADWQGPQRTVNVKGFELGKYEVTKGQFAAFVSDSNYDTGNYCIVHANGEWVDKLGSNWRSTGYSQTENDPVVCVSRADAQAYAKWLTQKTGQTYRLPSESEWEYACRAGKQEKYCGSDDVDKVAIYGQIGGVKTQPVGSKAKNAFGLYDMSGNVLEWVHDAWHINYSGAPTDGSAWVDGGVQNSHVLRGGSWSNSVRGTRATIRFDSSPDNRSSNLGFRVARTAP